MPDLDPKALEAAASAVELVPYMGEVNAIGVETEPWTVLVARAAVTAYRDAVEEAKLKGRPWRLEIRDGAGRFTVAECPYEAMQAVLKAVWRQA